MNTYHLFASITRERIEPEFQTLADGPPTAARPTTPPGPRSTSGTSPATSRRAPDFVAPHQPRVDFQLWFYGLAFQRRQPAYVSTLLERLCEDPAGRAAALSRAAARRTPPPCASCTGSYQFTSPAEQRATGAWWRRTRLATMRAYPAPSSLRRPPAR